MIRPKDTPKGNKHVLSYTQPGQPLLLSEKDLSTALRLLPTIQHPYIAPTIYASYNGTGAVIVRPLFSEGSLRDIIYKVKPTVIFMKKYSSCKTKGLSLMEIRHFGRQILEAVKFLKDRGMLYDHIHSGNIMVDKRVCKLSDIEDAFLSLPSFYRTSLAEFRKIQTKEDAVVYAFGRILYEMGCGCMMKLGAMEMVSSTCHSEVRTLLESLLSESALKSGLPSIDDLISNPLFPDLQPPTDKPQLKVSSKLKEALKQVQEAEEADMHERAKKVHSAKKAEKEKRRQQSQEEKTKRIRQQWKADREKSRSKEVKPKTQAAPATSTPTHSTPAPPAPPLAPPAPPVQATPSPAPQRQAASNGERGALLSSIEGFRKGGLKKTKTNDRSAPRV
jgi:PX domain-containing protein kinase-like protein